MPTFVNSYFPNTECFDEDDTLPFEHAPAETGIGEVLWENALQISGIGLVLLAVGMAISCI